MSKYLTLKSFPLLKYVWFAFRLSSSVSTITPRASSATALEVSNDANLCYGLSLSVKFFLFLFVFGCWTGGTGWETRWKYDDTDAIPTPKVIIDQDSDPNATIVEITFGDRLGALLDTV